MNDYINNNKILKDFVQITKNIKINHLNIHFYKLEKESYKVFATFEMERITNKAESFDFLPD